jgi:hypothetical protein
MPTRVIPGLYAPSGGTEFAAGVSVLAYILDLVLGNSDIDVSNVAPVAAEDLSTGVGETTKDVTLASKPVIQGSFELNGGPSPVYAIDNGWGKIIEQGGSGITGWINYATGQIHLQGLTASTTYKADYETGHYIHTITPVDGNAIPTFNAFLGKDIFEHKFLGCVLNSLEFSVEQELANLALDIMAQKDVKKTLTILEDLLLTSGCHGERQRSFADVTLRIGDYGGALSDISAKVRALALSINNNATTEENVGLGSRFPKDGTVGALDITGTATLQFESTEYKEDFWGNASGAVDGDPTLKQIEVTINAGGIVAGGWGDCVITLGRVLLQSVNIQPSGREKLMQEVAFQAQYDCDLEEIITAIIRNYNRLHNP